MATKRATKRQQRTTADIECYQQWTRIEARLPIADALRLGQLLTEVGQESARLEGDYVDMTMSLNRDDSVEYDVTLPPWITEVP